MNDSKARESERRIKTETQTALYRRAFGPCNEAIPPPSSRKLSSIIRQVVELLSNGEFSSSRRRLPRSGRGRAF